MMAPMATTFTMSPCKRQAGCFARHAALTHRRPDALLYSTADNAAFASCGGDKPVFLWDVSTARVVRKLFGHEHVSCDDLRTESSRFLHSPGFSASTP